MNTQFVRYAQIEEEIASLEAEKALLKPVLDKEIEKLDTSVKTEYGVFQKVVNKLWTYTNNFIREQDKLDSQIIALREEIKERKLRAQLDKRATFEPKVTFRFIMGE